MEIKINKEIRNYTEALYFGLSARQCIFSALAVASAAAVYFIFGDILPKGILSYTCILTTLPFAYFGFFTYQGMNGEEFASCLIRYLFTPKVLIPEMNPIYMKTHGGKNDKHAHKNKK